LLRLWVSHLYLVGQVELRNPETILL